MGNSSSSSSRSHDETVDFGFLNPQGVYTGPQDWNQAVVTQLICARRLAPFYRPLEDYDDSWTDDQILAARKEHTDSEGGTESASRPEPLSASSISKSSHSKRPNTLKEPSKPEAAVYRGATECPICFLYYPPNINHSRCCDQAICTECFVQIKRSEPTTTHLVSEPAACPYCVQENFGVVYTPPPWRAGIGSEGSPASRSDSPKHSQQSLNNTPLTHKRRQKSFSADSPEVVTTDQIRPDWEAKLAAVRAAVTRRANRRIIMRRVGDQLIPVGVTSGRVHALSPEEAANAAAGDNGGGSGSWRSRRRQPGGGNGIEQYLGQDLEELMMMEAMRLSLLEHEAQQKREAEEKRKAEEPAKKAESTSESAVSGSGSVGGSNPIDQSSTPLASSSHQKNDSLRVKRGSLFSRSRSPSPAPKQPSTSNSPPFPALGAALTSSTSTASAILSTPDGSNSTQQALKEPTHSSAVTSVPSSSLASTSTSSTPSVPPSIVIAPPPLSTVAPETMALPESQSTSTSEVALSPTLSDDSNLFENLPSSPEEASSEPLIPKPNHNPDINVGAGFRNNGESEGASGTRQDGPSESSEPQGSAI